MKLDKIFDTFSLRHKTTKKNRFPIGRNFRNRILLLCSDAFGSEERYGFWPEIHRNLQMLHGEPQLSNDPLVTTKLNDTIQFLLKCKDEFVLDFIEYVFSTDSSIQAGIEDKGLVEEVNHLFEIDDLPYCLTPFVREPMMTGFSNQAREAFRIASYPKVICREAQVLHNMAIEPTLVLLTQEKFKAANAEFRAALEDYRKQDYTDCLTKCGSAFESVMKVICDGKRWPYKQTDVASALLEVIVNKAHLRPFLKQHLLITATLRNLLSSSHGAGTQPRVLSQSMAKFAVNNTAAGILLLVEETS